MRIDEISQRVVWHASETPGITKFRFLTHLGTWAAAAERALQKDFYPDQLLDVKPPTIFMYQVDMSQCRAGLQVQDDPNFGGALDHVIENMRFLPKHVRSKFDKSEHEHVLKRELPKIFDEAGIDYLWYYNRIESPRSKSFVVLDPECFQIVGVEEVTALDLIMSDPKMVDRMSQRQVWPPWWTEKIKKHLDKQRAQQKG
jgi:hypothetical protein